MAFELLAYSRAAASESVPIKNIFIDKLGPARCSTTPAEGQGSLQAVKLQKLLAIPAFHKAVSQELMPWLVLQVLCLSQGIVQLKSIEAKASLCFSPAFEPSCEACWQVG